MLEGIVLTFYLFNEICFTSDQNDYPMVIRFGYTNYKVDETAEVASANCKKCRALITEKWELPQLSSDI